MYQPISELIDDLASGKTTSRELTEAALDRISDPDGQGGTVFTKVYAESARAMAEASDALRKVGLVPSPIAGLPISIKDLFDVEGEITLAGSVVRDQAEPARADAPIVARLRAAGAVLVGRTNMTEFAYSGLGLNPHYGTPKNPYDRDNGRIPGGSSSGAAISVTDGMATAGIGTDTGGSVRIPSALCGLTGFKPTAIRVPTAGAFPLSITLDSIGPLAPTVSCCSKLDKIMAGDPVAAVPERTLTGLRFAIPKSIVFDGIDDTVAGTFDEAVKHLSEAGAKIFEIPFDELNDIPRANAKGGFAPPEAFAIHREALELAEERFDPRVASRIKMGANQSAADYVELRHMRADIRRRADAVTAPYDAILMPTVPIIAPIIGNLENDDEAYVRNNMLMLRNPSLGNFLNRCALSLPCHRPGEPPVGLMAMGPTLGDSTLLSVGRAIEIALSPVTGAH